MNLILVVKNLPQAETGWWTVSGSSDAISFCGLGNYMWLGTELDRNIPLPIAIRRVTFVYSS